MLPKTHIITGFLFSCILFFLFPEITLLGALVIFLSSFLIDVDHYFVYILRKKDVNLFRAYKWHILLGRNLKEKLKQIPFYHVFHSVEFIILLGILSFFSRWFFYILIGVLFHSFLDFYGFIAHKEFKSRAYSFISYLRARAKKQNKWTIRAIKNSFWVVLTTLSEKFGGLILSIFLARLLMPDLFGLYGLALSTILIFSSLTDMGLGSTLIKYLSRIRDEERYKGYVKYFFKLKFILVGFVSLVLLLSSKIIADYYHKPIFLALLSGVLFLIFMSFGGFFDAIFKSRNNFRYPFIRSILFQFFRVSFVLVFVYLFVNKLSEEPLLFAIFSLISFSAFFSIIFVLYYASKKEGYSFLDFSSNEPNKKIRKEILKFTLPLSALTLSGIFFGNIDKVFLGPLVGASIIGFYNIALSLVGTAASVIPFSAAFFPIFSRLNKRESEREFIKAILLVLASSMFLFLFIFIFSDWIIFLIYGKAYLPAQPLLKLLSSMLLLLPISGLYQSYLISRGRTRFVASANIGATILNILLNYFLIMYFLQYSQLLAAAGAAVASILSRIFSMVLLFVGVLISKSK